MNTPGALICVSVVNHISIGYKNWFIAFRIEDSAVACGPSTQEIFEFKAT
jgi:hypothetical protein